ncbi:colicin lysis protein, partial [Brachyspira pilosicoli]|nr:colicin lysis protein [Brachyspira pilosicoli]
ISLITDSAKKALESKKVDEQFVINYRNSSAVILKDNQDIVFDGDSFIVNNVLNLVIPIKSDLVPIRWYIKHKPDSMSYAQIGQYFLFKNYNNTPISIKPDGLISNLLVSGGMSEATFYIKNEKIQNLLDGESIIICFEFQKYSTVNGYYTDNLCIEIK